MKKSTFYLLSALIWVLIWIGFICMGCTSDTLHGKIISYVVVSVTSMSIDESFMNYLEERENENDKHE